MHTSVGKCYFIIKVLCRIVNGLLTTNRVILQIIKTCIIKGYNIV